jgi:endonuclease/exonuclease/phosphatase family metal-dependent hydrolase
MTRIDSKGKVPTQAPKKTDASPTPSPQAAQTESVAKSTPVAQERFDGDLQAQMAREMGRQATSLHGREQAPVPVDADTPQTVRDMTGHLGLPEGIRRPTDAATPAQVDPSTGATLPPGVAVKDPLPIHPSKPTAPNEVMVATYNVENLFDAKDDPNRADESYTPQGREKWTDAKIDRKIENLGRVLKATNGGRGPDLVALVEVENKDVVQRLRDKGLKGLGYQELVHKESEDFRGIDNAILSRFPMVGEPKLHTVHKKGSKLWGDKTTRGILEATFKVKGEELTVFVNHWPSKRGGETAEQQRREAGKLLRNLVDEKRAQHPGREIVLLGDFNADVGEGSIGKPGLDAADNEAAVKSGASSILNTTAQAVRRSKAPPKNAEADVDAGGDPQQPEMGTHYYHPKKHWSTMDHIMVSDTLLDGEGLAWVPGSTQVVREDFMTTKSGAPKRFYQPRVDKARQDLNQTGYSDHLPVVARLRRVPKK